ncbi:MAG: Ldh family oxidoreductase [Candidatus Rokuibacteriota bacterium]
MLQGPPQRQVLVSEAALRRTTTQIFEKLGVAPEDAADAADVLVMTDLRGVETHGVSNMLRVYVRDYRAAGSGCLYPGLSEAEELAHRRAHGIPLHEEVIQWFGECTSEMGLPPLATSPPSAS